jgi:CheY-like chemotaxis protein
VSLPQLLLVDDSEAMLELEKAALAGLYAVSTAPDGKQALEAVAVLRPDLIVLDLSMPVLTGDQVLATLQADPALRTIPVIIVSSERERGERCLALGAAAFLLKPIKAEALLTTVARVLEERADRTRATGLAVLPVLIGDLEFGIPLHEVHAVANQPATKLLAGAPPHLQRYFELYGDPVLVLDLAERLGVTHQKPLVERKVVVLSEGGVLIAAVLDDVKDPEEFEAGDVVPRERIGGTTGLGHVGLKAMVRTARGSLPVLEPSSVIRSEHLAEFAALVRSVSTTPQPDTTPQ